MDRLEKIKEKYEYMAYRNNEGQDALWLISEIERLKEKIRVAITNMNKGRVYDARALLREVLKE